MRLASSVAPFFRRKPERWDFVWLFPDGTVVELRADDTRAAEFERRKDQLRSLLKGEKISSGEYVERFKSLCLQLGTRVGGVPQGYALSKEYAAAKVYSRKFSPRF